MLTIGTHMSIAGGIAKTAENVVKMEANIPCRSLVVIRGDQIIKHIHQKR